jgi:arsenite methyltransferase
VDVEISNCVINLATDKVKTLKEIYRILKKDGKGRIIIYDLVTSKQVNGESINAEDWCSCIDGALTKENYINSIQEAGFQNISSKRIPGNKCRNKTSFTNQSNCSSSYERIWHRHY